MFINKKDTVLDMEYKDGKDKSPPFKKLIVPAGRMGHMQTFLGLGVSHIFGKDAIS